MRHRRAKGKEQVFEACSQYIIQGDPRELKGKWQSAFEKAQPIQLEIGSGKGQYITTLAEMNPDMNFLACEGLDDVYVRILEKVAEKGLKNLRLIPCFMDNACEFFEDGELSKIYINFCDPWPKKRHIKRRLTERGKLMQYKRIVGKGNHIQLKTDNDDLFEFSLEEFEAAELTILEMSRDLHNSPYAEKNIKTEYETKFSGFGKSINYALTQV